MTASDDPTYPFVTIELPGGVYVHKQPVEGGERVTFTAGGREVSPSGRLAYRSSLPDGAQVPCVGTWFWQIESKLLPLPYGPYSSQQEAEAGARRAMMVLFGARPLV